MSLHSTKACRGQVQNRTKAKVRCPNEVEVHPDDSNSDDSALSLDSEFGVPIMRTPGVKKALTSTNKKLRLSSQEKTEVNRSTYNEYMAHHYAFAMKVVAEQEPERPSLYHRLEGENRPNRANHGMAVPLSSRIPATSRNWEERADG